ncbi:hypothetical protein B0H65DRAFT_560981 [Neurospora tetraspora]|uniref:DUF6594 domain-containing protein n=1 Tax=Neurospora tetraspora TaxID=94610 RepID=A0AAE0J725_9PEZI|nr:hypothetical protein B0H65DRAFT_560981 [Neurospora tetraspora]
MEKGYDYRPGYPRFTALISAHGPYFLCRRFDKLRARILLLKQNKLSMLEERLEQVDSEEPSPLFLGKSRCDRNAERLSLLSQIEACLADYDQFTERANRVLSFGPAQPRDEASYLAHHLELVSLAPVDNSAVVQLTAWVENIVIWLWPSSGKNPFQNVSKYPNIYIDSSPRIKLTAQALLLLLITLMLLLLVVLCNIVSTTSARIIIVIVFTIGFLLILSGLTKSKTMNLILAGATYATILIAFISKSST